MADIKAYRPASNSLGSGQVLQCPYAARKGAGWCVREMADQLALDLVEKGLCHRSAGPRRWATTLRT